MAPRPSLAATCMRPVSTGGDLTWRSLAPTDAGYPRLLREIAKPPPIEVAGELDALAHMVAIVGSRRCSVYGEELAFELGHDLALAGIVVVSGLALGIDGSAHRGALAAGGRTIAVMGTGRDTIYPHRHRDLARQIAASGALVTQFPPDAAPHRGHFPARNATISGMCLGVVVVEAKRRSGAMLTAGAAGSQGRTVMAMPGSVHSPTSRGCHDLVRDGARLVCGVDEVLQEIDADPIAHLVEAERAAAPHPAYGDARDDVISVIAASAMTLDEVCDRLPIPARDVVTALAELRLDGVVELRSGVYEMRRFARPGT